MGATEDTLGRVRQHRERLEAAAAGLEGAIARPTGDSEAWTSGVRSAVAEVGAALQAHVDEVEAPGGLYTEVIDRTPRLVHAVDLLRREHVAMAEQIAGLDEALADRRVPADDVREQALALLGRISRHRHRGADLIWDSFDYDIGAGD